MNPAIALALSILSGPASHPGQTIQVNESTVCMRNDVGHAVCITMGSSNTHHYSRNVVSVRRNNVNRHRIVSFNVLTAGDLASLDSDILPFLGYYL
jgi:hypothetical protein